MDRATVRIEPIARRHAAAIRRLAAAPEVAATTLVPHPYPSDGAARFVEDAAEAWEDGVAYSFAVLADGVLVGSVGLKEVDREAGQADLGYWIGVPFWGRGYATAAARRAVAFGVESLGLRRITAHTLERNPASARVLERVGFHLSSRERNVFDRWSPDDVLLRYVLDGPPP